jgi:tripartite-type tricarboxylate transporter receptor subunit TctC
MPTRRQSLALLAAGCAAPLCSVFSGQARAQNRFPDQPVKMIVPFAAGGPADIIARIIGQVMGGTLPAGWADHRAGLHRRARGAATSDAAHGL